MTDSLIATEARARQLLACLDQGYTYVQIIEREGIPLTRTQLKWRLDHWKRKLGLLHLGSQPAHFPRLLPPQEHGEPTTAYHQRVMAMGLGLCHWCHHQTAPGHLFCELQYSNQTCREMVDHIGDAGHLDGGLCGCDEVVVALGVAHAPLSATARDTDLSQNDMSGICSFSLAMLGSAWKDAQGLSVKASPQDVTHAKLWLRSLDCLDMAEALGYSEAAWLARVQEVA